MSDNYYGLHVWAHQTHILQTEEKAPKSDISKQRHISVTSTIRKNSKKNVDNVNQGSQSGKGHSDDD